LETSAFRFRRILAVVDGSEASEQAFERLLDTTCAEGGWLTVMMAPPRPVYNLCGVAHVVPTASAEELRRFAERRLERIAYNIPRGLRCSTLVASRPLLKAVLERVVVGAHDVVVVCGIRSSWSGAVLSGIPARTLARRCPVPVLLIRRDEGDLRVKADVLATLRRLGVSEETIEAFDAELEDPVDLTRDSDLVARNGLSRERFVDWMGGSR
jgi:nucleotide-binding universal stress UspA family protein